MNGARATRSALPALLLAASCVAASCAAQPETLAREEAAVELRRIPAAEANQGVAADAAYLYVIDNRSIGKYDKGSGSRVGRWEGESESRFRHLNAGVVREGRLYVAHSNYPEVPMRSSIEIFDAGTLRHLGSHDFGVHSGSATWIDFHDGAWWVAFANYDGRGGTPGRGVETSTVERFDPGWRHTGRWLFPDSLIDRFRPYSNSGGFWGPGERLYLTGHDAPEIYTLRLPAADSVLEWTGTIPAPFQGQGVGKDPADPQIVYAIDRRAREVIVLRLP